MHDLQDLINQFENVANELKVVVFDNANLNFYMHLPISFVKPVLMLGLLGQTHDASTTITDASITINTSGGGGSGTINIPGVGSANIVVAVPVDHQCKLIVSHYSSYIAIKAGATHNFSYLYIKDNSLDIAPSS